jgi:hypothetical protein
MVRETWTDERLDDLAKRMDNGFGEVGAELRQQREQTALVREELGALRNQQEAMNSRFDDQQTNMNVRFDDQRNHVDTSFNALMRTIQIGFSLIGVLIAGLMTLIGIWL